MNLAVVVREGDPTPPFRQIFIQMCAAIASGDLHAGTKLPSVRTLASDLGLSDAHIERLVTERLDSDDDRVRSSS